jgi:tungstate transport system substrate-binding protein
MKWIATLALATVGWAFATTAPGAAAEAEAGFIILQSTTSTQNSGLLDHLLPLFQASTGIEVRPVIVGTGQALRNGRNGDGDVVLVHAKEAEQAFVNDGYGVERFDVMYNDFVIVGPAADPAEIGASEDAASALAAIAASKHLFTSRADDSGTHKKERRLWEITGVDVDAASGTWYRETGSGMGATLNTAVAMGAYTLSDRGTWISFRNKGEHRILVEGDPRLFNPYGAILVNPERHPRVRAAAGQQFIDWLIGAEGQRAIAEFRIDGQQLFYPSTPTAKEANR